MNDVGEMGKMSEVDEMIVVRLDEKLLDDRRYLLK